jgi:hypothetical protein
VREKHSWDLCLKKIGEGFLVSKMKGLYDMNLPYKFVVSGSGSPERQVKWRLELFLNFVKIIVSIAMIRLLAGSFWVKIYTLI